MSLYRARLIYWAAMAVLLLGYFIDPGLRAAAAAGVGVLSLGAIAFGVRRLRPRRWPGWLLIATAVVLLTIGEVLLNQAISASYAEVRYPQSQDFFFVLMCPPLIIGLLWLGRPQVPSRDWPMILDTAMLSLAGSLLTWVSLVQPAVVEHGLVGLGRTTAIASWVAFVALLAAAARIVLAWRRTVTVVLLGVAVLSLLSSAFFYGTALVNDWGWGSPVDVGFLIFCGLCATAALTESMAPTSVMDGHVWLAPSRLVLLTVAILAAPTVLLYLATSGAVTAGAVITLVAMATGILMVARLALTAHAVHRRELREQAVRLASGKLSVATTEAEVLAHLTAALRTMVHGEAGLVRVVDLPSGSVIEPMSVTDVASGVGELVVAVNTGTAVATGSVEPARHIDPVEVGEPPATRDLVRPVVALDQTEPSDQAELSDQVRMPGRAVVFVASTADLAELAAVLFTLAQQAGAALARIDLIDRLVARERERYFRTLVQTSSDVILILRDGRVDYATPSAWAIFGRDIRHARFDDVITPAPTRFAGQPAGDRTEGHVRRADGGVLTVLVDRRDLTDDATVNGVVVTLRDVTVEREAQRTLAYRATHDSLTGLVNAERFREELGRDTATASAQRTLWAVLFIDLDDFKAVNDAYGHDVGDGLLVIVADRIRTCLRDQDLAARLGGDEFAVLLRDIAGPEDAAAVAQRITDSLAVPAFVAGVNVSSRASIGVALAEQGTEHDSLLRRADAALYSAKAGGKGRWHQYDGGTLDHVRRRADRRAAIEAVIRQESLILHYQPIVELSTGDTVGFEALIRSTGHVNFHGDPPTTEEFIAAAEDTNLIVQLGDWVLSRALRDAARLCRQGTDRSRFISVNVSARQLREPGFVNQVQGLLNALGVAPSLLVLEITEQVVLPDTEPTWISLAQLRHAGIRVAIDDYGTGYASLSYLRQPDLDLVKIDHTFLRDVDSPRNRTILDAVITLTHKLGLEPVAEGIEDAGTRDFLLSLGCRYGQGYLFARPMPVDEAADWDLATHAG